MTSLPMETAAPPRRAWLNVAAVVLLAVMFAQLEAVEIWLDHRGAPQHDQLAWLMTGLLPAWLLLAVLVPLVAALCRRFRFERGRVWRAATAHVAGALVFPLLHFALLATAQKLYGQRPSWPSLFADLVSFHYTFDVLAFWAIAGTLHFAWLRRQLRGREAVPAERPNGHRARFVVRGGGVTRVVPVEAVQWIEARNYYVRLHTAEGRFLVRESLAALEAQLDPAAFVRLHRSAMVNVAFVTGVRRDGERRVALLAGGVELPASRGRWAALKEALGSGAGCAG